LFELNVTGWIALHWVNVMLVLLAVTEQGTEGGFG
jgi:hypothetical protein